MTEQKAYRIGITAAIIVTIAAIAIATTTTLSFKEQTFYFEDVPFDWDDDIDSYDIFITKENTLPDGNYSFGYTTGVHYYIKSDQAHLVYSEDWSCWGEIAARWNAYGKKIYDGVTTFYINVNYAEEEL